MRDHLLAISLTTLLWSGTQNIYAEEPKDLGVSFSDPSDAFSMPAEWVDKPIKHDVDDNADLVVTLDQQSYVALRDKVMIYGKENGLKIIVKEGTCGLSSGMLEKKSTDIGGFCCPAGKVDRLPNLKFHTLGIAAVTLIVHPDNPIESVSLEQAREIFRGDIEYWSQLGQQNSHPIKPVTRLHCKKRPGHWKLLLPHEDHFSLHVHDVGVIPDMISKVSSDTKAIGYETILMTEQYASKGKVKALRIDGISPDNRDALIRTAYPLYRTYNVTTWTGKHQNKTADLLVGYLLDTIEDMEQYHFISHKKLRDAGWKFHGNELIGTPTITGSIK